MLFREYLYYNQLRSYVHSYPCVLTKKLRVLGSSERETESPNGTQVVKSGPGLKAGGSDSRFCAISHTAIFSPQSSKARKLSA